MMKLVQVVHPGMVRAMRSGGPVVTHSHYGDTFSDVAKLTEVPTNIPTGCRACGCPLTKGMPILSVMTFDVRARRAIKPTTEVRIHAHDCWERGAMQYVKLDGTGGLVRYVEPTHGMLLEEMLKVPFMRLYDTSYPPARVGAQDALRVFIEEDSHDKLFKHQRAAMRDRSREKYRPHARDPYALQNR